MIILGSLESAFLTRIMVGGGQPILPEILGQTDPVGAKKPIFNRCSLVAPQPYQLAKKNQLTLTGSPLCAFK